MKLILSALALFTVTAHAELYFVETMICEGQVNKPPPDRDPSYAKAGFKVTSFWSMRKSDCSLAPSSGTEADYEPIGTPFKFSPDIGSWIGAPLKITGDTISVPNSAWANPIELTITGSNIVDGVQTDTLEGHETLYDDYYYDYTCTANVVKNPARIVNNTKNCP